MKKIALFGLGSLALISLAACTVSETDEGKENVVSNYEYLPVCSTQKNLAGVSYVGEKFYVEEEDAYYLCKESGWAISDSTSTKKGENLVVVVDSSTVSGTAFVGGYFEVGSPVVLRELKLDTKKNELVETGNVFNDEISSANGDFVISNVSLYSNYATVEVTGLYRDMKTGVLSEDSIKLSTIVDMADSAVVKVSLFSEMELPRVKKLVKDGYSVNAAKVQAEHELLTALGFGGSVDDVDAAMLATAILFRNLGDESDLVTAIENFADAFAENGTWDDDASKIAFADFAFALENLKIRDEETDDVVLRISNYRKNLEANGMASVPGFEAYLTKFWNNEYGLGGCGSASESVVLKNANENSDSANAYFICKSGAWAVASDFERDTLGLGSALDGTIAEGMVDAEKKYVYDSAGTAAGTPARWLPIEGAMWDEGRADGKMADSLVRYDYIGHACTDFEDVRYSVGMSVNAGKDTLYWGCKDRKWIASDAFVYKVGSLCHEGVFDFDNVETVKVGKVTRYLHCDSTISADKKDTTWTWQESLTEYDATNGICDDDHTENFGKVFRQKKDGAYEYTRCSYSGFGRNFAWSVSDSVNYTMQYIDECDPYSVVPDGSRSYVCKNAVLMDKDTLYFNWRLATDAETAVGDICSEKNLGVVATDGEKVDAKYYRCSYSSFGNMWMGIYTNGEAVYLNRNAECVFDSLVKTGSDYYVCKDSSEVFDADGNKLYTEYDWAEATTAEILANAPCNKNTIGKTATYKDTEYKCAVSYPVAGVYTLITDTTDENYNAFLLNWYKTADSQTALQ